MKKYLLSLPLLFSAAAPAFATAGMSCGTGGPNPIDVELIMGRTVGAPLISVLLTDGGVEVATERAQWWLDGSELRLLLIDPNAEREELEIRAKRRGDYYIGTVKRGTRSRRVRCEESG